MNVADIAARTGHEALALVAVLLVALVGRAVGHLSGQPTAMVEIASRPAMGPVLPAIGGERTTRTQPPVETAGGSSGTSGRFLRFAAVAAFRDSFLRSTTVLVASGGSRRWWSWRW